MTVNQLIEKLLKIPEEDRNNPIMVLDEIDGSFGFLGMVSSFHTFLYDEKTPRTIMGMANYDLEYQGILLTYIRFHGNDTSHPEIKRGVCFHSKYPRITADEEFNEEFNKTKENLIEKLKKYNQFVPIKSNL
jgi:hypothetical protein